MTDIPRRNRLDLLTPTELALFNMVVEVESLGAHPFLTDVVILLGQARNKLADWVELPADDEVLVSIDDLLESED